MEAYGETLPQTSTAKPSSQINHPGDQVMGEIRYDEKKKCFFFLRHEWWRLAAKPVHTDLHWFL